MSSQTDRYPAARGTARPAQARPRSRRRRFVPPQHGAWAMLVVPYLVGVLLVGPTWVHLPLLAAWMAGYLWSYYVFQALKSRRPGRYRPQLTLYSAVALPLVAVVAVARPAVLWYAPAYAFLVAVNAWYAWRRRERALGNDLVAVLQSSLMVFVTATVAAEQPVELLGAFAATLGYFAGTVWYVKTMIRERGNAAYRRWSVGYHLAAFLAAAWAGPVLAGFFGWLLLRAAVLPRLRLSPLHVGLVEIGNCVALIAAILLM
ncbi:MAG TPA: YwiC-like family protein [Micromonosporaceae bacterium]